MHRPSRIAAALGTIFAVAFLSAATPGAARADAPADASADAPAAPDALQEITITSEKTTANLQKTAAAVSVISADTLLMSGVTDLQQAEKLIPSVRFQAEGNNTQVFIRGVGANLDFPNIEPNVAFNFAGIYLPREADSAAFFDIQQLELLPGSQGTLYGRSAIGGTINLTPVRPDFNNNGQTVLEVGNHSAVHAMVAQNIRASDTVAFRAAVDYAYNDGLEVTGADSKNDLSARLSALLQPNDKISVYLWAQSAHKGGHSENLVNKGMDPATGDYCETCFLYSNPWNDTRTGQFASPFGVPKAEPNRYKAYMIGGQIDYQLAGATLSYLPSYLYLDSDPLYWLSALQSTNSAHYNQISQELRLANNGDGRTKWLAGLYYFNSRNSGTDTLFPNLPFGFYHTNVEGNRLLGYAAFGQLSYKVTDSLRIIGGGRFSSTQRTAHGFEVVAFGGLPYSFDKTYTHVDWKVGAEKDMGSSAMLYATVQTGYQPGTFNALPNTPTFSNEVKPENLRSYTVGFKSRWFDDRLQINDELYYYDFHNLIVQAYDISAPYNVIFNANKITVKGNQLDILASVFKQDQLNLNVGYSRARNIDVVDTLGNNFNGLAPAYAPDTTVEVGYTHNMTLGAATLRAHIDWRWESNWFADYVHNLGTEQVASDKGDASLTYDADRWSVGAWIKNIPNRAVIAATAAAGLPGPATAYLSEPRTYGLRFTARY